jgi:hypothetical protein
MKLKEMIEQAIKVLKSPYPWQVVQYLRDVFNHWASESSITRRTREMPNVKAIRDIINKKQFRYVLVA